MHQIYVFFIVHCNSENEIRTEEYNVINFFVQT